MQATLRGTLTRTVLAGRGLMGALLLLLIHAGLAQAGGPLGTISAPDPGLALGATTLVVGGVILVGDRFRTS